MGQILRTNSNYDIIIVEGGTITLNTGPNVGTVRVTGNLLVEGDTLTVSAENLNIQDNIIILNFGETGAGISLRYSGIQIDRGVLSPASLIYDEINAVWMFAKGSAESTFNFTDSAIKTRFIKTDTTIDDGDLTLIGSGTGVVKVAGTNNYRAQVTDLNDIPNKDYVDTAIQTNPTFQIRSPGAGTASDTRVIALDSSATYPAGTFPFGTLSSLPSDSEVAVVVNNRRIAAFRDNHIEFTGLTVFNEENVVDIATGILGNIGLSIPAVSAVNGIRYRIQTTGSPPTDYTLIGSPSNTIGTVFTKSGGSASGNGTVAPITEGAGAVVLQSDNTNSNIKLETNGTGKVQITYALQLDNHGVTPSFVTEASLLYAGSISAGTSGLYSANAQYTGELVLKNRALLFSMIF